MGVRKVCWKRPTRKTRNRTGMGTSRFTKCKSNVCFRPALTSKATSSSPATSSTPPDLATRDNSAAITISAAGLGDKAVATSSTAPDLATYDNSAAINISAAGLGDKAVIDILPFFKSISTDKKWQSLIESWVLFELEKPPKGVSIIIVISSILTYMS